MLLIPFISLFVLFAHRILPNIQYKRKKTSFQIECFKCFLFLFQMLSVFVLCFPILLWYQWVNSIKAKVRTTRKWETLRKFYFSVCKKLDLISWSASVLKPSPAEFSMNDGSPWTRPVFRSSSKLAKRFFSVELSSITSANSSMVGDTSFHKINYLHIPHYM